jgi:hypothetical protein
VLRALIAVVAIVVAGALFGSSLLAGDQPSSATGTAQGGGSTTTSAPTASPTTRPQRDVARALATVARAFNNGNERGPDVPSRHPRRSGGDLPAARIERLREPVRGAARQRQQTKRLAAALDVESQFLRVTQQVPYLEPALACQEQVVHLAEPPLSGCGLGHLRGQLRTRVDVLQR